MDYAHFNKLLTKGEISGIFLFHGEEEHVKQSALTNLIESIDPLSREFNVAQLYAPSAAAIKEACELLPFLSHRRLIICRNIQEAEARALFDYAPNMPDTTTLILYMRGKCGSGLVNKAKEINREVIFEKLTESVAQRFVSQTLAKRGIEAEPEAIRLIVEMVGLDASSLLNETTKAADFVGPGARVTAAAVKECVTSNEEYAIFNMLNEFFFGKTEQGLRIFKYLVNDDSNSAIGIAHYLSGQCKNMLSARLLLNQGAKENPNTLAKGLKLKPYSAKIALAGAKRLKTEELRQAVLDLCEINYLQISGRMSAAHALELAVLKYFAAK
ncbi:MAG TPA: DNA polymerase III subunit delta [Clostridia bacterium]|nr:DNA polymerase III subunit delta [Clostridia bacterium]